MAEHGQLRGQTVFLTGAADGVGAVTARALVGAGASVGLLDVKGPELNAVAAPLGDRARAFVADVTDLASLETAVAATRQQFGGVDAVIANAGIEILGSVEELEPAAFRRIVDVNLVGTWNTVRATLPAVLERRGYYLIVSSLSAITNGPLNAAYNATKAGVVALAHSLRVEVTPRGVAVGVSYLTYTATESARRAVEDPRIAEILAHTPGGRLRPIPVERVAARYVRAIARRERRILFDRSSRLAVAVPEVAQAILERLMRDAVARADAAHRRTE